MRGIFGSTIAKFAIAGAFFLGAGREARAETTGASFRAGTEFFVLDKNKKENGTWTFFVTPADDPTSGYWLPVRPSARRFSFLAADEDLLAYDVTSPANARYLKAKEPVEGARKDDKKFAKVTQDPHWRERFFRRMEDNIPLTGANVHDQATDNTRACPARPQAKTGRPCEEMQAKQLPKKLIAMIKKSAVNSHLPPALLAAIIQNESDFDIWLENTAARDACEKDKTKCAKYKWERGLGQLGLEVSRQAGIDWNVAIGRPSACPAKEPLTDACIDALEKECKAYRIKNPKKLSPYDCPAAAIEAAARKLKNTREQQADKNLHPAELAAALQPAGGGLEAWRNVVGAYNRGPRVANAYAEYHRQTGYFPPNYGAAWTVQRQEGETPSSKVIGYSLLHKEYINRCYVYRVVGICGGLPEQSLAKQFEEQVGSDLLEGGAQPRRGPPRRAIARE